MSLFTQLCMSPRRTGSGVEELGSPWHSDAGTSDSGRAPSATRSRRDVRRSPYGHLELGQPILTEYIWGRQTGANTIVVSAADVHEEESRCQST